MRASSRSDKKRTYTVPAPLDEALDAVGDAAEVWGGSWHRLGIGGTLRLPVRAGLRHGALEAQLRSREEGEGTEIVLEELEEHYRLHVPSFVVLLIGAVAGLFLMVAFFFPPLMPLIPAATILSLAAWFLVAARVRTHGRREFFELVRDIASGEVQVEEVEPGDGAPPEDARATSPDR